MGCCGERERLGDLRAEQKWDYINLSDFKSSSCFTPLSYGVLYIFLLTSIAVYGVDTFTAVNLLVFDRWSGQIKPFIPFAISKWIFAVCIILSWVFLVYRWMRALRAIKSGSVAASYLDPLAVRIQSIRMGKTGRGWRRFLVFAELTKSKKGAEYVALFTYFSFEAWMRIIFAEGPRQVVNALTLYSVMQLNLIPEGKHAANHGHTAVAQFFINVQVLANSNTQQAVILFSMLFTLIIWAISALSLAIAALMYILFLWHHIPSKDRGLSGYCRRKIDSRLSKIVGVKVRKALEKEDTVRRKGVNVAGGRPSMKRQPTIPDLQTTSEDRLPEMPMLSRHPTQATLAGFSTRPSTPEGHSMTGLHRQPTVPHTRPLPPSRTATQSSANSYTSFNSTAPLIRQESNTGYAFRGPTRSPAPLPPDYRDTNGDFERPPLVRTVTGDSQDTPWGYNPMSRPLPSQARRLPPSVDPLSRRGTGRSAYESTTQRVPVRSPVENPGRPTLGSPISPVNYNGSNNFHPSSGRQTSALQHEMRSQTLASEIRSLASNGGYVAFNPSMHAAPVKMSSNPSPVDSQTRPPYRNFTAPNNATPNESIRQPYPPQRSGTAPLPQSTTYNDSIYDSYYRDEDEFESPAMPRRAATSGPEGPLGPSNRQGVSASARYQSDYGHFRF